MGKRVTRRATASHTKTKIGPSPDEVTKGPKPRWTERVDASVAPEMKARMDKETEETGHSIAAIVRLALADFFEAKDGERIL